MNCPHCGKPLARFVFPAEKVAGQQPTAEARAPELEDATPTVGQPIDRRTAPTDRIER